MNRPNIYRRQLLTRALAELDRSEGVVLACTSTEADAIENGAACEVLRAIGTHVEATRARLRALSTHRPPGRLRAMIALVRAFGRLVDVRNADNARAYRSALALVRRSVDLVWLARALAAREQLDAIVAWCDSWLADRLTLLAHAEAAISTFADEPRVELTARSVAHLP